MLKEKRTLLTLVGAALSAVTAVLYAVFYGAANTSMNSMSWPAFGVLLVGAAAALVLLFVLKRPDIGACVAAVCHLSAFMLAIYAFYPYISAAVVGIDERVSIRIFDLGRTTTSVFDWLFYFVIHITIYLALFRLTNFRHADELDRRSRAFTTALTLACLVFLTVPDCMSNEYRMVSYPLFLVNRLYLLVLAAFILALCSSIEFQSRYRINMAIMDQVLSEERKQYQQLKGNIDVINILCHDLRHRLEQFSDRLTDEEIGFLRSAMSIYDSTVKTGSEVLDVVFHLNSVVCQKEGIQFTALADGSALRFVETRHLYSLFNNALSNAMEAVRKLDDPAKRIIGVSVKQLGGSVEIEIFNFFDGCLPNSWATTKEDRHLHGFGTKSMQYITQLYGGVLSVQLCKDIYNLHISIPIPAVRASS